MDEKFKDLLDDEELTALRLQALATKKRKLENADNSSDSVPALPINSIVSTESSNQIPFVQSDRNTYNNYTRRKHVHSLRRRGGPFPNKSNQRSNLIVISPVALNEGKDSEERFPSLILPQHKWCNSGNEDSMSPKTLRRTGPTRFNRHGSDSESSDSDFENSENDSGSNETVLQDEPPEHFSHLSPKSDAVPDSGEKQRRLSFQNMETEIQSDDFEKSETTSVYNCLKHSLSLDHAKDHSDNFVQNVSENMHSVSNEFNNYKHYNSTHSYSTKPVDTSEGFVEKQNSCIKNGESQTETESLFAQESDAFVRKCTGVKSNNSYYSSDASAISDNTKNHRFNDRKSKDFSDKRQSLQMNCEIQSSDSFVQQQREKSNMYFSKDASYSKTASRNYSDTNLNSKDNSLAEDDLRLELKKRMQEMQSRPSVLENCNDLVDSKNSGHYNSWDRNKRRHTYEEDRISEVHSTNLYGNRQNLNSDIEGNRLDSNYSAERYRDDNNANFNKRGNLRSISQDRNNQGRFFNKDKNKSELTFGSERNTYSNSDIYGKNNEINSKQGTSRLECSSNRDQVRHERSSSRGRSKYECCSSQDRRLEHNSSKNKINFPSNAHKENKHELSSTIKDKNKSEYRSSQEREKHEHTVGFNKGHREQNVSDDKSSQSQYKHRYSPRKRKYARNHSQEKGERRSSRNSSSDSSSQNSRRGFSSSSDSRSECSSSRDKGKRKYSSSPERSRQKRSQSRDRGRYKRSQSRDRGRYKRSQSRDRGRYRKSSSAERTKDDNSHSYKRSPERSRSKDGKSEHSPIQNRTKRQQSYSPDRNKHDNRSTQDTKTDDYGLNASKTTYKGNSNQSKQKFSVVSNDGKNRLEQNTIHEYGKSCNKFQIKKPESFQDSEKFNDEKTFERASNREQSITGKQNSQTYTKNTEKNRESKEPNQKFDKINNTNYKNRYSRSRSGSTSSYSSTSSSSSSQSLKPKIRSVPSVIKSVQSKSLDDCRTETFCEVKLSGKHFSTFQSDIGSTSFRKDAADFNKFSSIKGGRVDVDSKVSDSKRVPVHMRLGVLPRKRLIQMPKDVEAAFVNSSSSSESENVNTKCKRQNIRIVTDVYGNKSKIDFEKKQLGKEKGFKQSPELYLEKSKHTKTHR